MTTLRLSKSGHKLEDVEKYREELGGRENVPTSDLNDHVAIKLNVFVN